LAERKVTADRQSSESKLTEPKPRYSWGLRLGGSRRSSRETLKFAFCCKLCAVSTKN